MDQAKGQIEQFMGKPENQKPARGQAEVIQFTSRGKADPDCSSCGDTGLVRVETDSATSTFRKCTCATERVLRERLAVIPARFSASTFESFVPQGEVQTSSLALLKRQPESSYYLTGPYGSGKTHLLYAQYRLVAVAGRRCHVRSTRELVLELQRAELHEATSPVLAAAYAAQPYHFFWDDIDKLKMTDFRYEVLFDLVDAIYRNTHSISITSNLGLRLLGSLERLPPAILRRIDDMCTVIEL